MIEVVYVVIGLLTSVSMSALFIESEPRLDSIEVAIVGLISVLLGVMWPITILGCIVGAIGMKVSTVLEQ